MRSTKLIMYAISLNLVFLLVVGVYSPDGVTESSTMTLLSEMDAVWGGHATTTDDWKTNPEQISETGVKESGGSNLGLVFINLFLSVIFFLKFMIMSILTVPQAMFSTAYSPAEKFIGLAVVAGVIMANFEIIKTFIEYAGNRNRTEN